VGENIYPVWQIAHPLQAFRPYGLVDYIVKPLTKINFTLKYVSQNALKLTYSNVEFQKNFPGGDTSGPSLQGQEKMTGRERVRRKGIPEGREEKENGARRPTRLFSA